jgi:hypothetical protein
MNNRVSFLFDTIVGTNRHCHWIILINRGFFGSTNSHARKIFTIASIRSIKYAARLDGQLTEEKRTITNKANN